MKSSASTITSKAIYLIQKLIFRILNSRALLFLFYLILSIFPNAKYDYFFIE